ncbi:MAG: hypothetical protein GXP62_02075 [Oligoflexia bacterium]|nr:hypothetical protein [Oligoflexia bacterium]
MITLLALSLSTLSAQAETQAASPVETTSPSPVKTWGEARLIGSAYPNVAVDAEGTTIGQGPVVDSRLRAGLEWSPGEWTVGGEIDLLNGQLFGDTWDIPGTEDARRRDELGATADGLAQLRQAYVDGRIGIVGLKAGLVTSDWGLGLLANDGSHDPVFGRTDFGDRVLRLQAMTRPFKGDAAPLLLVLAGDRVVDDIFAQWSPTGGGQAAWQGIASAIWTGEQTVGVYTVYRHQTEEDRERTTNVGIADVYADAPVALGSWSLRLAGEAVVIGGNTDITQSITSRDGLKMLTGGATVLASLTPADGRGSALLRAGWTSGDSNPDDGVLHEFSASRDFDVGMVLFDELQGAIDANTYAMLQDPANSGGAPEGADGIVTEGALHRAAFVQPVISAQPLDYLGIKAGLTLTWATAPPSQAYYTFRNGGIPTNQLDQPTSGYALGTELDWALTLGEVGLKALGTEVTPTLLIQGGHLLASQNLGGGTVSLVTATARMRW